MHSPLTVLIPAAGHPALIQRTLESLAVCDKPASYAGTLVVENGPRCGIEEVVAGFDRSHGFRYLHVSEANKSHALNVGLTTLGDDDLVVYLDDDVRVSPQLLTAYAEGAAGVQRGEFYGGPLSIDNESNKAPEWLRRYLPKSARGWRLPHGCKTRLGKAKFLGPNWAAFAADIRRIGGFETRLGPGAHTGATGQETDAQRRLEAAGIWPYYLPQAHAWHYVRACCHTPQWIIERARRHGVEWGIKRARRNRYPRVNRFLYSLRHLEAKTQMRWQRWFYGEKGALHAEYLQAMWQGRLEGLELGRMWCEVPRIECRNTSAPAPLTRSAA